LAQVPSVAKKLPLIHKSPKILWMRHILLYCRFKRLNDLRFSQKLKPDLVFHNRSSKRLRHGSFKKWWQTNKTVIVARKMKPSTHSTTILWD